MSTDYPAQILNYDGSEIELEGIVNFTDPANAPGGSLPSGAASPVGVVTPSGVGALYIETTNGTLYIAVGVTSADWILVGGVASQTGEAPGVMRSTSDQAVILGGDRDTPLNGTAVILTDAYAQWNGNGAGLYLTGDGTDGHQALAFANVAGNWPIVNSAGTFGAPPGGILFPASDPHVSGAWWDNNGVLTRSSG